jgi:hypothetical protein
MCNTHGRRINVNRLDREGSGYVGRREPDFMLVRTPWFRGVDLKMGPEGAIYVSDWSDNGECHDHDGIHRTSGRIYRIAYGNPSKVDVDALRTSTSTPRPGWFSRRDIRWNQEKTQQNDVVSLPALDGKSLTVRDLGWLEATNQLTTEHLEGALASADPLTKAAAVQLTAAAANDRHSAAKPVEGDGCHQSARKCAACTGLRPAETGIRTPPPACSDAAEEPRQR